MEPIPGFGELATLPWYPGKTFNGLASTAQRSVRERGPWWPS
ncbi:hypothetical protein ABZ907_45640 [Nonomuraea wenchangensis]